MASRMAVAFAELSYGCRYLKRGVVSSNASCGSANLHAKIANFTLLMFFPLRLKPFILYSHLLGTIDTVYILDEIKLQVLDWFEEA